MIEGRLSLCVRRIPKAIGFRVKLLDSTYKFFEFVEIAYPCRLRLPSLLDSFENGLHSREKQGEAMRVKEF
jgi:hypothetical protein